MVYCPDPLILELVRQSVMNWEDSGRITFFHITLPLCYLFGPQWISQLESYGRDTPIIIA